MIFWIKNELDKNRRKFLTKKRIQEKAKQLTTIDTFKASKGWFDRFAKRNKDLNLLKKKNMEEEDIDTSKRIADNEVDEKTDEQLLSLIKKRKTSYSKQYDKVDNSTMSNNSRLLKEKSEEPA